MSDNKFLMDKFKIHIFLTNKVNLLGGYFSFCIGLLLLPQHTYGQKTFIELLITFLMASLFGYILVGFKYWTTFIFSLIITDFILFNKNPHNNLYKVLLQSVLISSTYIYWAFTEEKNRPLALSLVCGFFITQTIKFIKVHKIQNTLPNHT